MNSASRLIRLLAAGICAVLLAACGGGGGGGGGSIDGASLAAPATGVVSNADVASVSSVALGDSKFRLVVWPGESQEFPLTINSSAGIAFDVEVTLGGATLTSIDRNGHHFLVVDATGLSAGAALPYKVRLRNRTSGAEAEVFGPINVVTPVVGGSATIGESGGDVVANAINTRVVFDALPGAQSLDVTLSVAVAPEGEQKVRIQFGQDVSGDERLMRIEEIAPTIEPLRANAVQRETRLAATNGNDGYPANLWSSMSGAFTENGSFRFDPAGKRPARSWAQTCYRYDKTKVCYYLTKAWDLKSTIAKPPSGSTAVATSKPTIFVHGFQVDPGTADLHGGIDYWGTFPQLVERHVQGATAFEFRWSTNAKFEMVATDLAHAIDLVHQKTGSKVTLIAHSFGGVLVRTLLEGLASTDVSATLANIDQVVTLGSPHSGIGGADNSVAAGFPGGQDSLLFKGCGQISCHQMGEPVSFVYGQPGVDLSGFLGLTDSQGHQVKAGDLAVRLRDGKLPADIRIAVGIGLSRNLTIDASAPPGQPGATTVRGGDVLITFGGQRFVPTLSDPATTVTAALAKCGSIDGKPVAEVLLGDDLKRESSDDWRVNMILPGSYTRRGYVHSPGSITGPDGLYGIYSDGNYFEALIDATTYAACPAGAPTSCSHAGFRLVYEAMTEGICSLPVVTPISDASATVGESLSFTVAARGWHRLAYQWFRQRVGGQPELISSDPASPGVVLSGLTAADDGAVVSVVVTNEVGRTETSAVVHVSPIAIAPQIPVSGDLRDAAVFLGQSTTYSVAATGTGPLSYQWKRNGVNIAGAAGPSYTTPATSLADSGSTFVVTVTNVAGSVTSRTATLTVTSVGTAPTITSGPSSAAVQVGAPATFSVTATGTQPNFEWRRGSPQSSVPASGATNNATYVIPATALSDNGSTYFVIVSNSAGSVTSNVVTLTILSTPPSIASVTVNPSSPTVGNQATFSVNGVNLQSGYTLSFPGCAASEVAGGDTAHRQFICTLSIAGSNLAGTVTVPTGTVIYSFVVTVGPAPPTQEALSIGLGNAHTCGVTAAGVLKCWGNNSEGELGDGTGIRRSTPVTVLGLEQGVVAVASGSSHACALTSLGGVKCWGYNNLGQLGDGTRTQRLSPVDVSGLTNGVIAISVGAAHTCAVVVGGGVKCWGGNGPEVGAANFTSHLTPVDVPGLSSGVTAISLGYESSCALTSAGGVKCWGYNSKGQIGGGSTYQSVPFDIAGLSSNVIAIDAGYEHICALTSVGGVKCWGDNFFGKLGNGSNLNSSTPVDVAGLTQGVVSVAAGDNETCAVTSAGGVMCWGDDGTGTRVRRTPVAVVELSAGVARIGVGGNHVCAVIAAGGLKCWEANNLGQVGDGTSNNYRPSPVDVVGF